MKQALASAKPNPLGLLIWVIVVGASVALLTTEYWTLAWMPALALVAVLVLWRNPGLGFLLFVALLPFEGLTGLSSTYEQLTVLKLLGALLALIMVVDLMSEKSSLVRLKSALWLWLLALLVVSSLSALLSDYPATAFNELRRLATGCAVFALALYFLRPEHLRKGLPLLLIGAVSLSSLLSVIGWVFDLPFFADTSNVAGGPGRSVGAESNANFFASTIVFMLPLLLYFFFSVTKLRDKALLAILAAVNVVAIITTYSRTGALIALLTLSLFFLWRLKRFRPRHLPALLLGGALVLVMLASLVPSSYWQRQAAVLSPEEDPAISRRLSYLELGWQAFRENPVLGSGLGSFRLLYGRSPLALDYSREDQSLERSAHNSFVEIGVGTGILGLAAFLTLLFATFRSFYLQHGRIAASGDSQAKDLWNAYFLGFVSLILFSLFLSNLYVEYFWISLGISQIGLPLTTRSR